MGMGELAESSPRSHGVVAQGGVTGLVRDG